MPRIETSLKENDVKEGKLVKVGIDKKSIVLTRVSGKLYAMDSVCSHKGGPLEQGTLEGYNLICPWHGGHFDIRNAKASTSTHWVTDLHSYPVSVDSADCKISVDTG